MDLAHDFFQDLRLEVVDLEDWVLHILREELGKYPSFPVAGDGGVVVHLVAVGA